MNPRILKAFVITILSSLALCLASCHSSRNAITGSASNEDVKAIENSLRLSGLQKKLLEEAYSWLGTPYAYAKQDKGVGTDCSGMVMSVYLKATGCKLPRNSAKQADYCKPLEEKEAATGDLVFFATGSDPKKVSHVGIVVDHDRFIHASSSKGVVLSTLKSPYFTRTFLMFGRVPALQAQN